MPTVSRERRRALALPMVLVVVILVCVGAGSVYFLMQSGMKRTQRIRRDTEHLYLGEAILANIVNRLKKAPWEARYYATGAGPCSQMSNGAYHGAEYVAVVEDVVDPASSAVVPNLSDVLLRVTYRDISRNFFARVAVTQPTVLRPTNVNVERLTPLESDVTEAVVRAKAADEASADTAARLAAEAESNVVAREVQSMARDGAGPAQIQEQVAALSLDALTAGERAVLDKWTEARARMAESSPTKYADATVALQAALTAAGSQPVAHRAVTVPRTLFLMARAAVGEYEQAMATLPDPLSDPKDEPSLRAILDRAMAHLDAIVTDHPDSEDRPYALLAQASILRRVDDVSGAAAKLQELTQQYPDLHMWGEDQTVAGKAAGDGVVAFEKALLDNEGEFFLSANERPDAIPQVYFCTDAGAKVRVTCDPRPKDLVTMAADGGRVAYRAKVADGSYRCIAVDTDGNGFSDLTTTAQGDWRPSWATIIDDIPFAPILIESMPDSIYTTDVMNLAGLPPLQGGGTTLTSLLDYGWQLYNELTAAPYSVNPVRVRSSYEALKKASRDKDKSDGASEHHKKKHHNHKSLNKLYSTVLFLESVKDSFPGAATMWQSEVDDEGDDD